MIHPFFIFRFIDPLYFASCSYVHVQSEIGAHEFEEIGMTFKMYFWIHPFLALF